MVPSVKSGKVVGIHLKKQAVEAGVIMFNKFLVDNYNRKFVR